MRTHISHMYHFYWLITVSQIVIILYFRPLVWTTVSTVLGVVLFALTDTPCLRSDADHAILSRSSIVLDVSQPMQ